MSTAQANNTGANESGKTVGAHIGIVDSDRNAKTRRVVIEYMAKHPKYGKYVRHRTGLQVHDENNESRLGDRVEIVPCRRMSKSKSWRIARIVERAPQE